MSSEKSAILTHLNGTHPYATFVRYLLIGCTIFALDLAVWLTCVGVFGWDVRPSQALSRTIGALAGFFGHKYFSFGAGSEKSGDLIVQGSAYTAVTIFNILISPWVVYFAISLLNGLPGALIGGKVLAEVFLVVETYILLRIIFLRGKSK